jgi:hypothetical protein
VQKNDIDTIIVAAQKEGFDGVFLRQHRWFPVRISKGMLSRIKWVAAYQTRPLSAVTHIAKVREIRGYGLSHKYELIFDGEAQPIHPILLAEESGSWMHGRRYTSREKLLKAKRLADLFSER